MSKSILVVEDTATAIMERIAIHAPKEVEAVVVDSPFVQSTPYTPRKIDLAPAPDLSYLVDDGSGVGRLAKCHNHKYQDKVKNRKKNKAARKQRKQQRK
jgi:hypothetical protein